ncbi:hypothetical protein [Halorarum salinum]|uniref:hypothetical protein n=1 Tax=Halorarum salinum TaxID=2743089 RepID=UPI001FEBE9FB|nr:hypothetical protein [Halobaculum salinum]
MHTPMVSVVVAAISMIHVVLVVLCNLMLRLVSVLGFLLKQRLFYSGFFLVW